MHGEKRLNRRHWRAIGRRPSRRDGAVALVLFLLPWVLAWGWIRRHHHLDSAALGILITVVLGLPALWLAWVTYRRSDAPLSELSMAQVADQLAVAVGKQWEAEARIRRLNDPYPLPVSWDPANSSLTDSWESLVKLASSGAGWPAPSHPAPWAADPDGLAGTGGDLVKVLERVPTGRLVVLGEPGAGKTILMVRLVLDLLTRRPAGGPVPILVSIASWNPSGTKVDLRCWLAAQLVRDYPALADPPPAGRHEPTQAAALLATGLILPILDGLDEIAANTLAPAITKINDALRPGEHLLVTCRSQQYRDAVRPEGGVEVTLRAAASVQLRPLDANAVRGYLCDDAAGPAAKDRWNPVLKVLGTDAPAGQALETPLMVSLARTIYNPRPGEPMRAARHPDELCNPGLADRAAVESLLLDTFIPAAYRYAQGRWDAQDAERSFVWLARHLEQHKKWYGPNLTLPELRNFVPHFGRAAFVLVGVFTGVLAGTVAGLGAGITAGLVAGLVAGAGVGSVAGSIWAGLGPRTAPSAPLSIETLIVGLVVLGAAAGAAPGVVAGLIGGVGTGVVAGIVTGVMAYVGLLAGMIFVPWRVSGSASPRAELARLRKAAILVTVIMAATAGVIVGVVAGIVPGGVAAVVTGVCASCPAMWTTYKIARTWLALRHRLPWRLMAFLEDAHKRGVLRQAGADYQFRHIELQHRLASQSSTPTDTP